MPSYSLFHSGLASRVLIASIIAVFASPAVAQDPPKPVIDVYVGEIRTFAGTQCPAGFAVAAGQLLKITDYNHLFGVLAFTYGGDRRTTFALPDLRDRSVIGSGSALAIGTAVGAASVTLQASQVPLVPHTHAATFTPVTSNVAIPIPAQTGTMTVTPKIQVKQATGQVSMVEGSTLSQGGTGQFSAPIYAPSSTSGATVGLGGVSADVAGTASTAATSTTVAMVTGGTVSIGNAASSPTASVPTQSPALVMLSCIALEGVWPGPTR